VWKIFALGSQPERLTKWIDRLVWDLDTPGIIFFAVRVLPMGVFICTPTYNVPVTILSEAIINEVNGNLF